MRIGVDRRVHQNIILRASRLVLTLLHMPEYSQEICERDRELGEGDVGMNS